MPQKHPPAKTAVSVFAFIRSSCAGAGRSTAAAGDDAAKRATNATPATASKLANTTLPRFTFRIIYLPLPMVPGSLHVPRTLGLRRLDRVTRRQHLDDLFLHVPPAAEP